MKFPKMPENPYKGHYAEEAIKHLRVRGLLGSKYKDSMPLDEQATKAQITNIVGLIKEHSTIQMSQEQLDYISNLEDNISIDDFIKLASVLFNKNMNTLEDLKNEGILTENIYNIIKKDGYITNAQIYVLFSEALRFYTTKL